MDDDTQDEYVAGPASGGYDGFGAADDDDDAYADGDELDQNSEASKLDEAMKKRGEEERSFYDGLADKENELRRKHEAEYHKRSMALTRRKEAFLKKERELTALKRQIDALGIEEIDRRVEMYRKGQLYGADQALASGGMKDIEEARAERGLGSRGSTYLPRMSVEDDLASTKPFAALGDASHAAPAPRTPLFSGVKDEQELEKPFASFAETPRDVPHEPPREVKLPEPEPMTPEEAKAAMSKLIEEKEVALEKTHLSRTLLEEELLRRRAELDHERVSLNEEERAVVTMERQLRA